MGLGLDGGEPHRPTPHALGTQRQGCGHLAAPADASRPEHGQVDGVDNLGDQHHGADLAGVAAGFVSLGDDDVHSSSLVALGVHRPARQGANQLAGILGRIDHVLRRRAQRVGHESAPVGQRDLQLRAGRVGRERRHVAETPEGRERVRAIVVGQWRYVVAGQDLVHEVGVRGRNELADVVERESAVGTTGEAGRDDHVHAVGLVADLGLDPFQVDLEALRRVGHRSQHSHATGFGHRGHYVAAVAEGDNGELDAQHFGDPGPHIRLLSVSL